MPGCGHKAESINLLGGPNHLIFNKKIRINFNFRKSHKFINKIVLKIEDYFVKILIFCCI